MCVEAHIEELERRHGDWENQLQELLQHPSVDDLEITAIKRRKLAIRDRIALLRRKVRSESSTRSLTATAYV